MDICMKFSYLSPRKILFGTNETKELPEICNSLGKRALIIALDITLKQKIVDDAISQISEKIDIEIFTDVTGEPTIDVIEKANDIAKKINADFIVGIGGGSFMDTAKAVAAYSQNDGKLIDYIEGVGKGLKLKNDPLPTIAVPTTSGTGAEMTKNAVISGDNPRLHMPCHGAPCTHSQMQQQVHGLHLVHCLQDIARLTCWHRTYCFWPQCRQHFYILFLASLQPSLSHLKPMRP